MFKNLDEALAYIQENDIQLVDLKFCDLWGRWHHVTLTTREINAELMRSGVGFDGSSVGFKSVKSGDMALIPDLSTGFEDPFTEHPTLSFLCNIIEADTKEPFTLDPRQMVLRAEAYMKNLGIADSTLWGPEFEFYIFDSVRTHNGINSASYSVDSIEASWNSDEDSDGYAIPIHGGYHAIPPRDRLADLRSEMVLVLESIGVPVKYHHHEVGGPGQCEIETPLLGMLAAGDASMIIKYVTKMAAAQTGQSATFLPKPLFGEAGSGMHFHQQLIKGGKNAFYDSKGPFLLSQTALFYIGGLLKHAPAVLALTNPSTNSYRRLVPGFEAPVNAFFSPGNRSAAIRVPKYATEPNQVRFEFRPPDATCNPYFALVAQLMAGLDGIRHKIDPTAEGFGPIDDDIFSWTPEQRATIKSLPTSLDDALDALESDHDFLTVGGVCPAEMIKTWTTAKRKESMALRTRPHPFEIEMYYDL
jgi:glutamine synthetase